MTPRIYLDNNATTPLDPRVLEAVVHNLSSFSGNPSSIHSFGQESRRNLIQARYSIAAYLGVKPTEIIFTSGGTEGLNMILQGIMGNAPQGHLITSDLEHAAIYATAKNMASKGCQVTFLSPGLWGALSAKDVKEALRPNTSLIALMAVNNETGVKTDIEGIASLAREAGIPFLVDGVALLGKELFNIPLGVSAMCFSGHKLHAPKGVGFAFIRNNLRFPSLLTGGPQEYGKRGGTENISGIIGLAKAIEVLKQELPSASQYMCSLRDKFEKGIMGNIPDVKVNGLGPRVVNTTNIAFMGVEGESLLTSLDMEGIAVSHGSACSSGALEPSRVLLKMGISLEQARSSIRFSFSRYNTESEIDTCLETLKRLVVRLRKIC